MAYNFNAPREAAACIDWIKDWFERESGAADGIIIGMSGGADSTVTAKLCCEAVGSTRVLGVLMPDGEQHDIADAVRACELSGIKYKIINIKDISSKFAEIYDFSEQARINIPPRIRLSVLYALGQSINYRAAGTGNLSERYVGYFTKWGIGEACDFNPVADFTKSELIKIGEYLGLASELVHKIPADGLSGKSDEENMGISYAVLDKYIRTGDWDEQDEQIISRIIKLHAAAQHKIKPVPFYAAGG